ncbi:MAG TPA: hypothetical protein VFQ70_01740, partial [Candidatus Saccharimonadaceae bacterium]|nr:hypothetical protein [Candidatus Saccharimonadaceae bacterium]
RIEKLYQEAIDREMSDKFRQDDVLEYLRSTRRDFLYFVNLNSKLCERYKDDWPNLLAELTDWVTLLDLYWQAAPPSDRELDLYSYSDYKRGADDSEIAARNGRMSGLESRIKQRAQP